MTYPSCLQKICARIRRCPAALKKLGAQLLDGVCQDSGLVGLRTDRTSTHYMGDMGTFGNIECMELYGNIWEHVAIVTERH